MRVLAEEVPGAACRCEIANEPEPVVLMVDDVRVCVDPSPHDRRPGRVVHPLVEEGDGARVPPRARRERDVRLVKCGRWL
jgi:hypothetical protein